MKSLKFAFLILGWFFFLACNKDNKRDFYYTSPYSKYASIFFEDYPDYPEEGIVHCLKENPHLLKRDCEVKRYLCTPFELKANYALLKEVVEVLDSLKITYYAEGGTLLGQQRFNAIIPWDDDTDLSLLKEDFLKNVGEIETILNQRGLHLSHGCLEMSPTFFGLCQVTLSRGKFFSYGEKFGLSTSEIEEMWPNYSKTFSPHLDFFLLSERERLLRYEASFWQKELAKKNILGFPIDEFFPLQKGNFLSMPLNIPRSP